MSNKPKIYDITATGSTTPRDIRDRFSDVINIKDFGAVGDGIVDDTEAINAALKYAGDSGGGVVSLVQGEKYRITSKLLSFDRVQIDGHGATIISKVPSGFIFEVHGSLGDEIRIAQQPVSSASSNSKTIIKTVSSHGFSIGDRIIIQAARDALAEDSGKYRTGTPTGSTNTCQWAEVLTVNKIVSSTEFECTGTLIYPYYLPTREDGVDVSTQPTQRQYTTVRKANFLRGVVVKNVMFEVYGGSDGYDNTLLFDLCEDALVENVSIIKSGENSHGRGIEFCNCFTSRIVRCTIDASRVYHANVNVTHTYDNHFTFASCWYCSAEYVTSLHSGQNFDATYSIPTAPTGVRCPCIGIEVVGAVCHGSTDNAGTNHSGAWGCSYRNCRFTQYAYGMLVRSPHTVVDGCSFYGDRSTGEVGTFAIQLSEPTINGCAIINNIFHGSRGVRIYPFTDRTKVPKSRHLGILISGNSFFDTTFGVQLDDVPDNYAYEGGDSSAAYTDYACDVLGIDIRSNIFSNIKERVIRLGKFCNGVSFCSNTIKDFEADVPLFGINTLHTYFYVIDNIILGTSSAIGICTELSMDDPRNAKLDPNYMTHDVYNRNYYQNMSAYIPSVVIGQTGNKNIFSDTIYGAKKELYIKREYEIGKSISTARFKLGIGQDKTFDFSQHQFAPMSDNTLSLGAGMYRWKQVYAGTSSINTSDAREKVNLTNPNESIMKAWGKVNFKAFQFIDAVEKKGAKEARVHFGVIAQQVKEVFESEGLDVSQYALFCYDKWDDEYEDVEVVDTEATYDEDGNELTPQISHIEKKLVTPAGDRYGIRYSEALALEAAYQRWLGEQRDKEIAELKAMLANSKSAGYMLS